MLSSYFFKQFFIEIDGFFAFEVVWFIFAYFLNLTEDSTRIICTLIFDFVLYFLLHLKTFLMIYFVVNRRKMSEAAYLDELIPKDILEKINNIEEQPEQSTETNAIETTESRLQDGKQKIFIQEDSKIIIKLLFLCSFYLLIYGLLFITRVYFVVKFVNICGIMFFIIFTKFLIDFWVRRAYRRRFRAIPSRT